MPEDTWKKQPSQELPVFVKSPEELKSLLEGSYFHGTWEQWANGRRFIASAIDKGGSLLDYGSANGLLLKSLQVWSDHKLDPYGIDTDQQAIEKAKGMFPGQENHFTTIENTEAAGSFPKDFDFVYWNVWDDYEIIPNDPLLQKLKDATRKGGRLILGFYDTKEKNKKKIEALKSLELIVSGVMENPSGGNEIIAWFDQDRALAA